MKRLCIYPKDVQVITGKSIRHGNYIINFIKRKLGKQEHQYLTIKEFCCYQGLPLQDVEAALEPKRSGIK